MLHRLHRDERGIALYLTLVLITITLTFTLAAVGFVMAGTNQSVSDAQARRALSAAQSAMRMAVYRTNQTAVDLQLAAGASLTASNCLVNPLPTLPLGIVTVASGWCAGSPIDMGAGASGTYQISPAINIGQALPNLIGSLLPGNSAPVFKRTIVATGTAGGQTRRVAEEIQLKVTIHLGLLGLGSTLDVRPYSVVAGSFRECTPRPTGATPGTGC